jgi:hypothetical protein
MIEKFQPTNTNTLLDEVIDEFQAEKGRLPSAAELRKINPYRQLSKITLLDLGMAIAAAPDPLKPYLDARQG